MGKGDKRRPRQVPREEYEERWDQVFGGEEDVPPFQKVAREWYGKGPNHPRGTNDAEGRS